MSVEVIVPWLGGCQHREAAWRWVRGRLCWSYVLADGREPWCKATAVTPAIEASGAEVIVIHDADVFTEGLPQAIEAVQNGSAWAVPHLMVHRLSEAGTRSYLAGDPGPYDLNTIRPNPHRGVYCGGVFVARREVLLDCPMDPRFTGWGQEDESLGLALATLHGRPWRGKADLIHLYHPPADRLDRRYGSIEGRKLFRRYARLNNQPGPMRALIQEAKCDFTASRTPIST